ncbi:hypothetical protein AMTR_s00065p00197670 [Amborella trichopoda]|uniref:Uncharacterized protein n=1 Tax=Amborella trichopoda TaxID=13333 RepID=U5D873_AMBTC|nr:hypothetical protein AMTR_s00065p00197670 [Amborella trichopoda]
MNINLKIIYLCYGRVIAVGQIDGRGTHFWFEKWLGERPLKEASPELHRLAPRPELKVAETVTVETFSYRAIWTQPCIETSEIADQSTR